MVYRRKGKQAKDDILVVLNMTPVVHHDWKLQVQGKPAWKEIFNSDETKYYGTGNMLNPKIQSTLVDKKHKTFEINLHLPPLGAVVLK
jgi:1,4-alpha-glucan branching enzyme